MAGSPRSVTRTVAILKPSAVKHRLTIEPRLLEAGFEIVKERQMEFHPVEDGPLLLDLFGHEGASLTPGPIWVYVLERRRATEVLSALMGHEDPEIARSDSPKSLRAVYGRSIENNAIYGSPADSVAERQISILFASSPPFSAADIPLPVSESDISLGNSPPSTPSHSGRHGNRSLRDPYDSVTLSPQSPKDSIGRRSSSSLRGIVPIQPRPNRASILRTGGDLPPPPARVKRIHSSDDDATTFADVPGHKFRSTTIVVASCAPPVTAPRQTKASALRTGQVVAPAPVRERKPVDFGNTPGHKRSQTFDVQSIKPPTMAPRLNRSATLRSQGGLTTVASTKPSAPTLKQAPSNASLATRNTISRASSISNLSAVRPTLPASKSSSKAPSESLSPPAVLPRAASSASLSSVRPPMAPRKTTNAPPSAFRAPAGGAESEPKPLPRPSTADGNRPGLQSRSSMTSLTSASSSKTSDKPRPPSVASRPPSITPRTNKSAALRASMGGAQSMRDLAATPKTKVSRVFV